MRRTGIVLHPVFHASYARVPPLSWLLDLARDGREEVPDAAQVGLALELLVDGVVGADGRQPRQVVEVALVAALTRGGAQGDSRLVEGSPDGPVVCTRNRQRLRG